MNIIQKRKSSLIENQGEGDYYLVNGKNEVYEYDVNLGKLVQMKYTLFEYIAHRFEQVDQTLNTWNRSYSKQMLFCESYNGLLDVLVSPIYS